MKSFNNLFENKKYNLIGLYSCCVLTGILTGLIVTTLRLLLKYSQSIRSDRYKSFISNFPGDSFYLWILYFLILSLLIFFAMKKFPNIKGGGIPLTKAYLIGNRRYKWKEELFLKLFCTVSTIGNGFSLGRKGPSVQMGALIGGGVHNTLNRKEYERKYLVSSGAAAGISAAFNAPLAGVLFAIEELTKAYSPVLITCLMISSVVSDLVTRGIFGLRPFFTFNIKNSLALKDYPAIIGLALIAALLGVTFIRSFIFFRKRYNSIPIHQILKIFFLFLIAFFIGIMYTNFLGMNYSLENSILKAPFSIKVLLLFLVVKFIFTLICSSSGVPGGIFLPMLLIGALIGRIYGEVLFKVFHLDYEFVIYFTILGMASFFTTVTRNPITSSVLLLEMTGSFQNFFPLIVSSMIAFLMTELFRTESIYTLLFDELITGEDKLSKRENKITLLIPVALNSYLDSKLIKEVKWPKGSLIICISRGDKEFIPKGDTQILSGDILTVIVDEREAFSVKVKLFKLGEEKYEDE